MGRSALTASTPAEQRYFFGDAHAALAAVQSYRQWLREFALEEARRGRALRDQSHPAALFALRPARAASGPLLLLGGMGPLAGVSGFERACQRFRDGRELVLFQACFIPDRTGVVLKNAGEGGRASPAHADMVELLEAAITEAVRHVQAADGPMSLVVLCNTCHFFLPEVLGRLREHLPEVAARIRFVSLIEAAVEAIRQRGRRTVMALYTQGTRLSRIYARRFAEEGLSYVEPAGRLERALMSAIFDGVKASNPAVILEAGASLVEEILATGQEFDCIVAGCTEVPFILDSLRESGGDRVQAFLRRVEVIDPVAAALERA
jgi:aspartate racemase